MLKFIKRLKNSSQDAEVNFRKIEELEKFHKKVASIVNTRIFTTSKTSKIKKCPISRTNIVHFDTFALYQNVSYKMSLCYRFNTKRHPY